MSNYGRLRAAGASWFFTVNLHRRHGNDLLVRNIGLLRDAFDRVRETQPIVVVAWVVVLPEHMHWLWRLPEGDDDYSTRWRLLRRQFSRAIPDTESRTATRERRGERGIWQRRFWEHCIRDQTDLARHIDYIHWNPVKNGLVARTVDWPHSSFHAFVERGIYQADWGVAQEIELTAGE